MRIFLLIHIFLLIIITVIFFFDAAPAGTTSTITTIVTAGDARYVAVPCLAGWRPLNCGCSSHVTVYIVNPTTFNTTGA